MRYTFRYNTKNDGSKGFWRLIDAAGIEQTVNKIVCTCPVETEIIPLGDELKGNVVISALECNVIEGVAYLS